MSILYTNIQRFSLYDGPGIRTTVFLYSCNLRCPWCANPECVYPNSLIKRIGYQDLFSLLIQDVDYFKESGGGITFSGGDPLLQAKDLLPLFAKLHSENISIAIETSLFAKPGQLSLLTPYCDTIFVDLKVLEKPQTIGATEQEMKDYLTNFRTVMQFSKGKQIVVRLICNAITCTDSQISLKIDFLSQFDFSNFSIEIFETHDLGKEKYNKLNIPYSFSNEDSALSLKKLSERLKEKNIPYTVLRF